MINMMLAKHKKAAGISMTILGCILIPFDTAGASLLFVGLGLAIFFCKGNPYDVSDCFPELNEDDDEKEIRINMYKRIG